MIEGIDVSYYQGGIDWGEVAKSKRFAIVRSGDGTFLDPLFEQNVKGAVSAGIHVEVYHYLRFAIEPQAHAELLVRRLEMAKGWGAAPRLWLDWEDTSEYAKGMTIGLRQVWADRLCTILKTWRVVFGHYTGTWWWDPYIGSLPWQLYKEPLWIGQYPFWDGACQADPTAAGLAPTLPSSWDKWLIWQYTSKGRCPGIEGDVDLNVAQDSFLKEEDMDDQRVRENIKELLGYQADAIGNYPDDNVVREDMAKMRVQVLSVQRLVGLALQGGASWKEVRQIMDFYKWGT